MTSLTRTVTFHHWDVLFLIHHLLQDVIVVALVVIFEIANFYHRGRFGKIPLGFKFVPRLRPAGVDQGCEMGDFFLHRLETLVDRIISLKQDSKKKVFFLATLKSLFFLVLNYHHYCLETLVVRMFCYKLKLFFFT